MKIRIAAVAIIATLTMGLVGPVVAQNGTLQNNLFSQYTTHPGASQVTAGMYPAPYTVPRHVGSSYYTNQALMPHEMMYAHQRNYYNYYAGPESFYKNGCNNRGGGGALTKTTVVWQSGCNHMGPLPFNTGFAQNWQYKLLSRYYCLGGNCGPYSDRTGMRARMGARGDCASGDCGGGCANGDCGGDYLSKLGSPQYNYRGQAQNRNANYGQQGRSR